MWELFNVVLISVLISLTNATNSTGSISSLVQGKPEGFAAGTTGGGNATPVYPKDISELIKVLKQSKPAVIVIKKEYNFIGSEGKDTKTGCKVSKCGTKGQDAYPSGDWCKSKPPLQVTIDLAGRRGMVVSDSKTIIGVGPKAVLKGKGLKIRGSNIIVQNIAITEINPKYIFGGDAIDLESTDQVWIDRVSISHIGRQFIVTGYKKAGRVTISNSQFNGVTTCSGTCNNQHYWGFLFLGSGDQITMMNNDFTKISGRGPKVGGASSAKVLLHAVNNRWSNCDGHAFDVEEGGQALIEGNMFNSVKKTLLPGGKGKYLFIDESNTKECVSLGLGRACVPNVFKNSQKPPASSAKPKFTSYKPPKAKPATSAVVSCSGSGKGKSDGGSCTSKKKPKETGNPRMVGMILMVTGLSLCGRILAFQTASDAGFIHHIIVVYLLFIVSSK